MRTHLKVVSLAISTLLLASCASVPNGPSAMALPGTGRNFEDFRVDDGACRQFAQSQIGGTTANQASNNSFAETTIIGTVLGALVGAAAGGDEGAGVGAATGLFIGSAMGVDAANASSYGTQRRYDNAYTQCMYAKGHRVPVSGHIEQQPASSAYRAPPPPADYPSRPPTGYPPPPPPPGYIRPDAPR